MTISIKNGFLWKTVVLITVFLVMVCVGLGSASSKLKMEQGANLSMDTSHYTQINPDGELLVIIEPPAGISNHKIVPCKDDKSCGSAALATILRHSFHVDVNEMDVITGLLRHGDRSSIVKRAAFSFYDMKHFLETIGYTGTGYTIKGKISSRQFTNDEFETIQNTTIIPVTINGYSHFTIYRTFDDQYVYLGSPLYGNICLTFDDLSKVIVKRSIFVISNR
jgi:uncharacterized protein